MAVRIEEKCGVWRKEGATPSDLDHVEKEVSNLNQLLLTPMYSRSIMLPVRDGGFESLLLARTSVS